MPLTEEVSRRLAVGDVVCIDGPIFTSRDMGHLKIKELLEKGERIPVNFQGAAIFRAGPVVMKNDDSWDLIVIGPATSIRMEPYAETIGRLGVKAIIGKGGMFEDTIEANKRYGAVYLQAAPGRAVKLAHGIESLEDVHWLDLGMSETLLILKANSFSSLVVAMDAQERSIYKNLNKRAMQKIQTYCG